MFNNLKIKRIFSSVNLKTVGGTTLFQVLIFASGLIINKLIAIFSGPAGIAVFGVVKNFYIFFASILKLGSDAVILVQAASSQGDDRAELKLALGIVRLIFLQSVFLGLSIIFLDNIIYETIFLNILPQQFQPLIKILLCMIFLTAISETLISFNNGRSKIKNTIFASLVGTLTTLLLVAVTKPESLALVAIFALLSGSVSAFILLLIFAKDFFPQVFKNFKASTFAELPVSSYMLAQPLLTAGTFLIIQNQLTLHYGVEKLSFFILSYTLIGTFLALLMSSLRMYFIPHLGSLKNLDQRDLFFNDHLLLFLPISSLLSALIVFASKPIVLLLYSPEFIEAASYLALLALVIVPRSLAWIIAITALEEQRFRLYVAAEMIREFLYLAFVFYLIWIDADFKTIFIGYILAELISSLFWIFYRLFFSNNLKPKKIIILFSYAFPALLALFLFNS